MKVLMYGWEFPPHISGGLGVACYGLTKALSSHNHHISFVLPRLKQVESNGSHVNLIDVGQFPVYTSNLSPREFVVRQIEKISKSIDVHTIASPLSPYLTEEQYQEELRRLASQDAAQIPAAFRSTSHDISLSGEYGPNLMSEVVRYASVAGSIAMRVEHDVIHVHDWLTMLAGVEAKRISGKPLVIHAHALEFDRSGEHVNQAVYDIERYGFHQADAIIAVSHMTRNMIINRYGVSPDKVHVVHNAVAKDSYAGKNGHQKGTKEKVVLFLGRITFQKGPDYFVEAAAKVIARNENVRFVMAGSGDMAPKMIERIAELRLGRKFHFTGFLKGAEVEEMYKDSDLYVMPSVSEPFGISPLEAMRYDVPVIISKTSGVSEILDSALKVDFWDTDELADKILAVLEHEPLRQELVDRGSMELKKIQWENAADHIGHIYERIA
ncbi:MAG: glycosyltransferase family 4 protein [Deltaproteobacteria bacterium]|nr:glycosyltransferase family 4 protein [Deltaproteobacteria bacterium]